MPALDQYPQGILNGTIGALLLGSIVASGLYGVACIQTFIYFRKSSKSDRCLIKLTVATLWCIVSFQLLLTVICLYGWLITHFGYLAALGMPSVMIVLQSLTGGLSDLGVRCFFAWRVYTLCGMQRQLPFLGPILAAIINVLSLLVYSLIATSAISVYIAQHLPPANRRDRILQISWTVTAFNVLAVVVDSLIAASVCTLLLKNRTTVPRTRDLVHSLMTYAIGSGVLTSVVAISALIVNLVFPNYIISFGLFFVECQLHFNSLLVSLNARRTLESQHAPSATTLMTVPLEFRVASTMTSSIQSPATETTNFAWPADQDAIAIEKDQSPVDKTSKVSR